MLFKCFSNALYFYVAVYQFVIICKFKKTIKNLDYKLYY